MGQVVIKFFCRALILGLIVLLWPLASQAEIFTRGLALGSQRPEVKILQMFLNIDPTTRVSLVGDGSFGQETDYFGEKTKSALVKFQNKYGLKSELGRFGPQTRAFLDQKIVDLLASLTQASVATNINIPTFNLTSTDQAPTSSTVSNVPILLALSPNKGGNGTLVTLTGRNFLSQGNTIVSGYADLENFSSVDGQTIQFFLNLPTNEIFRDEETGEVSLPGNLHLPIWLSVANKNGQSKGLVYDLQI